ncbi:protein cramped [Aethina tumida]|uniref:protein cramped n=1 Tax=Aethina tumida TaxID=116153 RepID=UPI002147872B|nr:protein cramped [Aethina tumida]
MEQENEPKVNNEEEQLLGSVTTINNTEGSEFKNQQIRSSARVFKKMKLDSAPMITEKREKKEDVKQDINKKCCKPQWTSEDKNIFFEALYEYGKNFDSIHSYITAKFKKKGTPERLLKTKDQVRHLYHRTWQKISKYLKFNEGIKKVVQELYALINYGEIRRRLGSVSSKSLQKLNELIYSGSIVLRCKGKNVRINTPMCKALRRLNQLDEKHDELILPFKVNVEIVPKDMASFLKVQGAAQNPRLKATLPLQKRLSSLISCINKRWRSLDATLYDKAVISTNVVTNDCVPPKEAIEENKKILSPSVRLTPQANCQIEVPSINLSEYYTRQSICMASYENRLGIKSEDKSIYKSASKKPPRVRNDSISDKSPLKTELEITENSNGNDNNLVDKVVNDAVNTLLSLQQHEPEIKEECDNKKIVQDDVDEIQKKLKIESIRKGWTEETAETLTIGEIYLMVGNDSKVVLEYSWDEPEIKTETQNEENEENKNNGDVSASLNKLLSVAKMHYRKNIIKCPCGHVCGAKTNPQLNRQMESKIRKMLNDIGKCTDEADDGIVPEETEAESFAQPQRFAPSKFHAISPASYYQPNPPMVHLITQLKPRYCNRKGRTPRSKQVVVERKLPLLPNNLESGHQIVRMNIISQDASQKPDAGEASTSFNNVTSMPEVQVYDTEMNTVPSFGQIVQSETEPTLDNVPLNDEHTFVAASPSRLIAESDNQWINAEVADYSLSSLLGTLESPIKSSIAEDSRMSEDVDAQLRSLLTESSLDFSANFADLAAQVSEVKK